MLPKIRRLTRKDFLQIRATGKNYRANDLDFNRFAVVTSTKLHKRAVIRNKLRRRIYEIVKDLPGGGDIIILANKHMLNLNYAELNTYVHQILSKMVLSAGMQVQS